MKENWIINRIGLVDFWYYDDQEFTFINGRMLLRGSNGSGKSVTMQSVVPLLLDGNMRPERLDPFGSRDRKMSNYLLEEGDGREERTGYLYMEFMKPGTGVYHTIGMGIRARRGKNLESWYFYISDGRRINRDFPLYKESEGKITLSQKELEFRLGGGGRVLSTQQEYMEHVNRLIFGFESVEEYKELIDLLIQLRTPKLSKDFKPSVINEILSDSLQPLSEDDLRPMSEAIENMDTLSTNLSNKVSSMQAAEKINRQYDKYNEFILKEKTSRYLLTIEEKKKISKDIEKARETLLSNAKQKEQALEQKLKLNQERNVLEHEKETLNASDAVSLKQREADVLIRLEESRQNKADKNIQLEDKQDKWREYESRFKKNEEQKELLDKQITDSLQEMEEGLSVIFTDEHSFFAKDLEEKREQEVSFDTHIFHAEKLTEQLEKGIDRLKTMEEHKSRKEEMLQQYDQEKKIRSGIERIITEEENNFQTMIQEQKENIYAWNHKNEELKLSPETMQRINRFLELFNHHSDYHELKKWISDSYFAYMGQLRTLQNRQQEEISKEEEKLADLQAKFDEWKNKKDSEPEVAPEVQKNREKLKEKGIPYYRFYETVDFEAILAQNRADQLEEALLQMGILDALVIDKQYKNQILTLDPGVCDKYIFTDGKYQGTNLTEFLSVSEERNDIFGNHQILAVLGGIGTKENEGSFILEDGTYGMGVLRGTITGEYKARFIGVSARARYREEQIELLEKEMQQQNEKITVLQSQLENIINRIGQLDLEYTKTPQGEALREKANQIEEKRLQLKNQSAIISGLETELAKKTEQIRILLEQAGEIADDIYLDCRLDKFMTAMEEMKTYYKQVMQLKAEHVKYLQILEALRNAKEHMEETDDDMEQIRYELSAINKRIQKEEMELSSVRDQLKLTNYEEIKEKLDFCIKRLDQIPKEIEETIKKVANCENEWKKSQEFIEQAEPGLLQLTRKAKLLKENLKKELSLGYTQYMGLSDEEGTNWEIKVGQMYAALTTGSLKEEDKDSLSGKMNQVFYENRGYLLDFNPNFQNIFEEDYQEEFEDIHPKRLEITARYRGENIKLGKLLEYLKEEIEEINNLIKNGDKELFEDILANTIGRKIRNKINGSMVWVEKMNQLMESMNTSSGLKLSLRWRSKTAELEDQLDTKELVELLKKDARLMNEAEFEKLSLHFRSKVAQARRNTKESTQAISFFAIMRDTLDYRKWFEFQLFYQKSGEAKKELTNSIFGTFSGGEKAMAMYVPLFSAVVAKYKGAREDVPRIVSLDEAFAGVDNRNIRDMFRLMSEFQFNFIINSQVLWGDCDTLDGLAIYQLHRLNNQKFVTVMSFIWNGTERKSVMEIKN